MSTAQLTAEPHDKLHLGGDLVLSEMVRQVGQRVDVGRSAEQNQHLKPQCRPQVVNWYSPNSTWLVTSRHIRRVE